MRRLAVAALPLLAIALFGCGSSNNKSKSQATTQATPGAQTINIGETEYKLSPAGPKVGKTGTVTFKVTNNGTVTHSLEVEGPKGEARLGKKLQPGQSGTLRVDLSKAGKYEMYCPVDGHKGLGMKGEITVAGGGGGTSSKSNDSSGGGGY